MKNSKLMLEGRLDASEFLNRIVYQQSVDDFGLMDAKYVNITLDDEDGDEIEGIDAEIIEEVVETTVDASTFISSQNSPVSSEIASSTNTLGKCVICTSSQPQILIILNLYIYIYMCCKEASHSFYDLCCETLEAKWSECV